MDAKQQGADMVSLDERVKEKVRAAQEIAKRTDMPVEQVQNALQEIFLESLTVIGQVKDFVDVENAVAQYRHGLSEQKRAAREKAERDKH